MEKQLDAELTGVKSFLDKFCLRYADRVFLRVRCRKTEQIHTYRELYDDSLALSRAFLSHGFHGKHLAVISENRYEFLLTFFASLLAGAVFVPIDIGAEKESVNEMLTFADVDAVFCTASTEAILSRKAVSFDGDEFRALLNEGRTLPEPKNYYGSFFEEQTAMLCFTSGTSAGTRKCVMLKAASFFTPATHRIWRFFAYMGEPDDREAGVYSPLPMFHLAGLICAAVNITMPHGSTFMTSASPSASLHDVIAFNPHFILAVPALVDALCAIMEQNGKENILPNLREISVCGAMTPHALLTRLQALGIYAGCDYGQTECAPQITIAASRTGAKAGSVGVPCSFNEIKIENDILFVRGENVMKGYYKNPEATAEVLSPEGWLCTGDFAEMDDGCLYIKGRATSVVVLSNGENIDTDELSNVFTSHPSIAEIVILPDKKNNNNALVALIYPAADDVAEAVAEINRTLPLQKRIVRFRLTDVPFEKNEMMKIKRYRYREEEV